jgi:malate permease and related proteins
MQNIVNTLAPVFLVIVLGAVLYKTRFFNDDFLTGLTRLIYWIGLPVYLFSEITKYPPRFESAGNTFIVVVVATFGVIAIAYLYGWVMRLPAPTVSALVHCSFRGNLAYLGLPIIVYSLDPMAKTDPLRCEHLKQITLLVLAFVVPIYNVLAVVVLLAGQHKFNRQAVTRIIVQVFKNPLFVSCMLGVLYALFTNSQYGAAHGNMRIPIGIARTFDVIGRMALPLALLSVGAALLQEKVTGNLATPIAGTVIKIVVNPLLGFGLALLLGMPGDEIRIALLLLACPTAITAYVMTLQLGGDAPLSAAVIVITSAFAALPYAIILGLPLTGLGH